MDLNQRPSHYQCDALPPELLTQTLRSLPSSELHSPAYVLDDTTLLVDGLTTNFFKWIVSSLPCTSVLCGVSETRTHDLALVSTALAIWATTPVIIVGQRQGSNLCDSHVASAQTRLSTQPRQPYSCGGVTRTPDLQVMSLPSYHCSTPRYSIKNSVPKTQ